MIQYRDEKAGMVPMLEATVNHIESVQASRSGRQAVVLGLLLEGNTPLPLVISVPVAKELYRNLGALLAALERTNLSN